MIPEDWNKFYFYAQISENGEELTFYNTMDNIAKMDGFEMLTREQQIEVLNNPKNFIGLSEAANKSKGPKSYSDWTVYKKENLMIDSTFRKND